MKKTGKYRNRGLTSLDTLIIFIALTITTAVAAIVLITSGATFTQKYVTQSVESRKSVTAGVEVISVVGTDPSPAGTPHKLSDLFITMRLLPGTSTTPLNATLIFIDINGHEDLYGFNDTCQTDCFAPTTQKYNVYYLKEDDANHEDGYLKAGDIAKVSIHLVDEINEDRSIKVSIAPSYGPKTRLEFNTPANMAVKLQRLWPTS